MSGDTNSNFVGEYAAVLYSGMLQSRQIEAFRAVMVTGAMTTAAERIHVTQPAVSRLIRDLERQLGLTLFRRRGNLVVPTHEANALLVEVERSFVGLDQISAFADDLRSGRTGSLRVAVLPTMAAGFAPRFMAEFCRRRPGLKVLIDGLPSPAIRDRVAAGEYDIGVAGFPFQRASLTVSPLEDKAVIALPAGHRLAGKRAVRPEDLRQENLILLRRLARDQHPIAAVLQSARPRQVIETSLASIACVCVSEGMGVAIVDPFSVSEFVGRNVIVRRFEPSFNVGTAVLHSADRPLSTIAQEFRAGFLDHVHGFLERADYLRS
jgi:DNA-binding transcriptional LysR family regulator